MPHVDIELEDNKQFISNIPRSGTGLGLFLCICGHAGLHVGGSVLRLNDGSFLNQHHENMPI